MTDIENSHSKEQMLACISDLFLKYGLRSTSMEDICSHLKISKKTLYQFFNNKDDVVEQVLLYRRNNSDMQKSFQQLKAGKNAIEIFLTMRDDLIKKMHSQLPANTFDVKKYHPAVYQKITEIDEKNASIFLNEIINKGIEEGLFRQDINREVQTYLLSKQMQFLANPELIDKLAYPLELIISTIIKNTIRHFATPKGLEILDEIIHKK